MEEGLRIGEFNPIDALGNHDQRKDNEHKSGKGSNDFGPIGKDLDSRWQLDIGPELGLL